MKSILIIAFTEIRCDPRVGRHLHLLSGHYKVYVAGFGERVPNLAGYYQLPKPPALSILQKLARAVTLLSRRFEWHYWASISQMIDKPLMADIKTCSFDLVLANDIETLPLALMIAQGKPVLYDAHEYSPREFDEFLPWRMLSKPYKEYLCRQYLYQASGMFTVGYGIAEEYKKNYGVSAKVVPNASPRQPLLPSQLEDGKIRMIHHGGAISSRKLEKMIDLMNYLDCRFTLDFMLVPSQPAYLRKLEKRASGNPRIRFLPPVSMEKIPSFINPYDIGLYILEPSNFNNAHALPNKFFEFIQARLGIAIGPTSEMARLTQQYGVGIVADTFEPADIAEKLNAITTPDIQNYKQAAHAAAAILSFEAFEPLILEEVDRLIGPRRCAA